MATEPIRNCPDCSGVMNPIIMIDKAHGEGHRAMEYALGGAKPSFFLRRYPIAGTVSAIMCSQCGRIVLYGVPKQE